MPELALPKDSRPRFSLVIPESFRLFETDPKKVTFVPLTMGQEADAFKAAEAGRVAPILELIRRSVEKVNDKTPDGLWLENSSPKIRTGLGRAYRQLFDLDQDEFDGFFASKTVDLR